MPENRWRNSDHRLLFIALVFLALFAVVFYRSRTGVAQTLKGSVTVVDAAHNGTDIGAHCSFNGITVTESFATYDVAERVKGMVLERGGIFFSTLWNGGPIDDTSPSQFKKSTPAKFTFDSTIATSDTVGIRKRIETGRKAKLRYPDLPISMVTLHLGRLRQDRVGVRIINGSGVDSLASAMKSAFGGDGYINEGTRSFQSLEYSPSEIRSLGVLNSSNPIKEKVALILGNSRNPLECRDMADPKRRQAYAELIVRGLEKMHNKK